MRGLHERERVHHGAIHSKQLLERDVRCVVNNEAAEGNVELLIAEGGVGALGEPKRLATINPSNARLDVHGSPGINVVGLYELCMGDGELALVVVGVASEVHVHAVLEHEGFEAEGAVEAVADGGGLAVTLGVTRVVAVHGPVVSGRQK
jgi:hypothetical protein